MLPSNSIPGYISKKNKNTNLKRYMLSNVHSWIIYNCQIWKQSKCPSMDEGIKKMWCIYNRILLSHKKEWNFAIWSNMDGLGGYYTKWNKSEKDKYYVTSLLCGIEKIKQTSKCNKKSSRLTENKVVATSGQREGERGRQG